MRIALNLRQDLIPCFLVLVLPVLLCAQTRMNPPLPPISKGVAPGDKPAANQLWQEAATFVNRGQYHAAVPYLLSAAQLGDARAESMLGFLYERGQGVTPDNRTAAHWFGLAAIQGQGAAEYALGALYERGEGGLPKDPKKAAELFAASAAHGFDKSLLPHTGAAAPAH